MSNNKTLGSSFPPQKVKQKNLSGYSINEISVVCRSNFLLFDQRNYGRLLDQRIRNWLLGYLINERPLIEYSL